MCAATVIRSGGHTRFELAAWFRRRHAICAASYWSRDRARPTRWPSDRASVRVCGPSWTFSLFYGFRPAAAIGNPAIRLARQRLRKRSPGPSREYAIIVAWASNRPMASGFSSPYSSFSRARISGLSGPLDLRLKSNVPTAEFSTSILNQSAYHGSSRDRARAIFQI